MNLMQESVQMVEKSTQRAEDRKESRDVSI